MSQSFIKLFIVLVLFTCSSSLPSNYIKSYGEKNSPAAEKSSYQIEKLVNSRSVKDFINSKTFKQNPIDAFDKPVKLSSRASVEHAQLKRSDGSLLNAISDAAFQNKLEEFNMTNVPSNYHYPINLMYANNLTVKNYFLMVPHCNATSDGRTLEQFQSARLDDVLVSKENTEFALKPVQPSVVSNQSLSNTIGSTSSNTEFRGETQRSTEAMSYLPNITVDPKVALGNTTKTTIVILNSSKENGLPGSVSLNVNPKADFSTQPTADKGKTTLNEPSTFISVKNNKSENYGEAINASTVQKITVFNGQTSNPTAPQEDSKTLNLSKLSSPMTQNPLASIAIATPPTTLDYKARNFFQTVDKYCETFVLADKGGTYTIHPVTFDLQDRMDPKKSDSINGNISALKGKRTLSMKNPKQFIKLKVSK